MTRLKSQGINREARKVLYVEDDRISVTLFQAMLAGRTDISLFITETAEEGIVVARRERPEFIFLDIELPGMDGIAALAILRTEPGLKHSRFIGLSANAMLHQIKLAEEVGFDRYITKPYTLDQITSVLGTGEAGAREAKNGNGYSHTT